METLAKSAQAPEPDRYVLGFAFEQYDGAHRVLLIRRTHPTWQAGQLNGLGGRSHPGEIGSEAMAREFREESGLVTAPADWREFLYMSSKGRPTKYSPGGWLCHCYMIETDIHRAQTMTDEKVEIYAVDRLPAVVLPNVHWMVRLAIDPDMPHGIGDYGRGAVG